MSFLAPLYLLAAAAIAGPLLLHLIRRNRGPQQTFSSLLLLRPTPLKLVRRRKLDQWLLLLLRALAIVLLALAFARPFFPDSQVAQTPGRRIVLMLDTSASMRREGLWSQLVQRVDAQLKSLAPNDRLAILAYDRSPRWVMSFDAWNHLPLDQRSGAVLQQIDRLSPGWAGTDLGSALLTAAEAMRDDEASADEAADGSKHLIVISDLQSGSRLDALRQQNWPENLLVHLETITPASPTNAGLTYLQTSDPFAPHEKNLQVRIRLHLTAGSEARSLRLRWEHESKTFQTARLEPGQSRILQLVFPKQLEAATLVVEGDDHDFDNRLHLARPQPQPIDVLLISADPFDQPEGMSFFIQKALTPTQALEPRLTLKKPRQAPDPMLLDQSQWIIATDPPTEAWMAGLREQILGGKELLWALRSASDLDSVHKLLGRTLFQAEESSGPVYLAQLDFEHPLFSPFTLEKFNDFSGIRFWHHRRLRFSPSGSVETLARFDNGDPALLQIAMGRGHILLLTSGWHRHDSQLALSNKFVPLIYSALLRSSSFRPWPAQHIVGDNPPDWQNSLALESPDGATRPISRTELADLSQKPGLHALRNGTRHLDLAVNSDPQESRTEPLNPAQLEAVGLTISDSSPQQIALTSTHLRQLKQAEELESRSRLWRWGLLATFGLLLVETTAAGWTLRKQSSAGSTGETP